MKKILLPALIIILLTSCDKNTEDFKPADFACDGLITDPNNNGDDGIFFMPNAFTANKDGLNDTCKPICRNIASINFTLFDVNGNTVFTTTQLNNGWAPATGTANATKYYYRIQAVTIKNRRIGDCGTVYDLSCIPKNINYTMLTFEDMLALSGFVGVTRENLSNCP